MQPSEIAAHLMRHTSFHRQICPIRRGKIVLFFSLVHVASTVTPEKKKRLNAICPIRRGKTLSFFSLAAASSTGVHRVTWKKDGFVLLGALFIGRRPDCHVS